MATNESSGRWDASGSFEEAVNEQKQLAYVWAKSLDVNGIFHNIELMAYDPNALTLYQRTALLTLVLEHIKEW